MCRCLEEEVSQAHEEQSGTKRSSWVLYEQEPFSQEIEDYRDRRRTALVESMHDLRAGKSMYSRRVVSIWAYQRRLTRNGRDYSKAIKRERG